MYVNHFQNDWVDLLPMAKFAANANPSASTKILPFQVTRGYVPKMSFNPVDLSKKSTHERLTNSKAWSIATSIEEVWKFVRNKMIQNQEKQAKAANQHRKEVEYKIGDRVWLLTKNINIKRPLKKLDHKMISPYTVK